MVSLTRALSPAESFNRARTANRYYSNFQVTATYSIELTVPLLYKALRKMVLDYHMFICNVFQDDKQYYFNPLEKVTLGEVLKIVDPKDKFSDLGLVNESWMKEVNTVTFNHNVQEPLFRLFLLGEHTLTACFEHSIADGTVGVYIHQILAENFKSDDYDEAKYGKLPEQISLDSVLFEYAVDKPYIHHSLVGPVDPYLEHYSKDFTEGDPNHYSKVAPAGFSKKYEGRTLSKFHASLAFKLLNFTIAETKQILRKCKSESVTLTSYTMLVMSTTLQPFFKDAYPSHKVALNLRRHCPEDIESPGRKIIATMAHVGISQNLPPTPDFSWDTVRAINADLVKTINNKKLLNMAAPFLSEFDKDPLTNYPEAFSSQLGKPRPDATKFSNLGFVDTPLIDSLVFGQDVPPAASEFLLNAATTPVGGMNLVMSYYDDAFDDVDEEVFLQTMVKFKQNLLKYV